MPVSTPHNTSMSSGLVLYMALQPYTVPYYLNIDMSKFNLLLPLPNKNNRLVIYKNLFHHKLTLCPVKLDKRF